MSVSGLASWRVRTCLISVLTVCLTRTTSASTSLVSRLYFITLSSQPLNSGFRGSVASTSGRKSERVLSLIAATRSRSPATSDGRIWFSRSVANKARASLLTLPEKSTKTTTSVPRPTVAWEDRVQPASRSAPASRRASVRAAPPAGEGRSPDMS